jgi:hypothetical protein
MQVADDHLGAAVAQGRGAVIEAMHQRADVMTALEEQLRGVAAGSAGCSGDEQCAVLGVHRSFPSSQLFATASLWTPLSHLALVKSSQ